VKITLRGYIFNLFQYLIVISVMVMLVDILDGITIF